MPIFVCNFCGGDHGGETCSEQVVYRGEELSAVEAIDSMFDSLDLSSETWQQIEAKYDHDHPIEMLAYIVANFSDDFDDDEIKAFFPPVPDDGKIYNASRKHGNCFQFAFDALIDGAGKDIDDGEIYLVHGYVSTNPTEHTGHAWLESDNKVIDCGAMHREITVYDKLEYYERAKVASPEKFNKQEALKKMIELNHYGSWCEAPPENIKMSDDWVQQ
ncbi:MAG: hypothetical protein CME32_24385 [Gimesia sp.]|nr:hypothetical protein [Gimesia sp.]